MPEADSTHCGADAIDGYLDGELDERASAEVEAHLRACAACAERVRGERLVRDAIASPLRSEAAPAALRRSVEATVSASPLRRAALRTALRYALPLAAVLAALVLVRTLGPEGLPRAWAQGLAQDHAEHHGASGTDFLVRETDPRRLAAWFSGEAGAAVELPAGPAGAELVGGLLCLVNGRRVPHAVYRLDGRLVSYYVLPEVAPPDQRVDGTVGDLRYVAWNDAGRTAVAIGGASVAALGSFVQS
jgi:anti-sigma factor RsiW